MKEALKILKSEKYLISKACDVIEQEVPQDEYVKKFVQFIRESKEESRLEKQKTQCANHIVIQKNIKSRYKNRLFSYLRALQKVL